jgi:hypothetical protein
MFPLLSSYFVGFFYPMASILWPLVPHSSEKGLSASGDQGHETPGKMVHYSTVHTSKGHLLLCTKETAINTVTMTANFVSLNRIKFCDFWNTLSS